MACAPKLSRKERISFRKSARFCLKIQIFGSCGFADFSRLTCGKVLRGRADFWLFLDGKVLSFPKVVGSSKSVGSQIIGPPPTLQHAVWGRILPHESGIEVIIFVTSVY